MVIKRLGLGYILFGALLIWAGVLEQEAAATRLQRLHRRPGCDECPADQQRDPVPAED